MQRDKNYNQSRSGIRHILRCVPLHTGSSNPVPLPKMWRIGPTNSMQRGIWDRKAVWSSVCPSNAWIVTNLNFCPHSYTVWKVDSSSFPTWRTVGGHWGSPLPPDILGQITTSPFKNGDFQSIFARSASVVTEMKWNFPSYAKERNFAWLRTRGIDVTKLLTDELNACKVTMFYLLHKSTVLTVNMYNTVH